MVLETSRLILRPWMETDAESLYEYAKNPLVGPAAGWPVHTGVENSRQIIRDVLSADGTYAVVVKSGNSAVGSIGLMIGGKSGLGIKTDEAEIGYWIGVPYWGQGMIPEAAREIMRYAFDELNLSALWCGYFDGNEKSKRVNEKCGFRFHHTEYNKEWPLIGIKKTQHVTCITKTEWLEKHNYGAFNAEDFFRVVANQDAPALQNFFTEDAVINWHNTNEQFNAEEYIRANCEYPGNWNGTVERVENTAEITVVIAKVCNEELVFRVTSFIKLVNNKIRRLDEYWGDVGAAPEWRVKMKIGKTIN